jgi:hypothetical protein
MNRVLFEAGVESLRQMAKGFSVTLSKGNFDSECAVEGLEDQQQTIAHIAASAA